MERNSGGPRRFGPREMHQTVCSECGRECEVPFIPTQGRPVYCRDCLNVVRDERRSGNNDRFGPREMHTTTCSDCGDECEVPFVPKEGRPVYCRECLPKHRGDRF
jgi:CxxC-x17-CxxC domain-containing protein